MTGATRIVNSIAGASASFQIVDVTCLSSASARGMHIRIDVFPYIDCTLPNTGIAGRFY